MPADLCLYIFLSGINCKVLQALMNVKGRQCFDGGTAGTKGGRSEGWST